MNEDEEHDETQAEQARQPETASDAEAEAAPVRSDPIGINPRLWFNRRPRNRRK